MVKRSQVQFHVSVLSMALLTTHLSYPFLGLLGKFHATTTSSVYDNILRTGAKFQCGKGQATLHHNQPGGWSLLVIRTPVLFIIDSSTLFSIVACFQVFCTLLRISENATTQIYIQPFQNRAISPAVIL